MNITLEKDITDSEIMEVFRQMDPRKALGIDGISGLFYKKNWNIVSNDVLNLCKDILNGKRRVAETNDTMIILIPKFKDPIDMTYYMPISLCRVVYNIISRVIANTLKPFLPDCINLN